MLTVTWSARLHHLPHDYVLIYCFGLIELQNVAGFTSVTIKVRGNDLAVNANSLPVLLIHLLRPRRSLLCTLTWILEAMLSSLKLIFLCAVHATLMFGIGSTDDPLGNGVSSVNSVV